MFHVSIHVRVYALPLGAVPQSLAHLDDARMLFMSKMKHLRPLFFQDNCAVTAEDDSFRDTQFGRNLEEETKKRVLFVRRKPSGRIATADKRKHFVDSNRVSDVV